MAIIKNPNDIVTELVNDYKRVFDDILLAVVIYGNAITHEYRPGISDVTIIVVLKDASIEQLRKCRPVAQKWHKRNVSIPFFMTPEFIASVVNFYPIEFLDIQTNHRILYGEDYFSCLEIDRGNLRLLCERELRDVAVHLKEEFVKSGEKSTVLRVITIASMKKMIPVFKALLRLNEKPVPKSRSDMIMAIEDLYNLGASALSGALNLDRQGMRPKQYAVLFDSYGKTVDLLVDRVEAHFRKEGTL